VINNKISNVCAPDGVATAERVCEAAARLLGMAPSEILPSSTGVIGWQLPASALIEALPQAAQKLGQGDALTAAQGIMTTDLYPKVRARRVGNGRIVGIAKGAGMIEPNLATMLVYLMTDCDLPRDSLRAALRDAVEDSFHEMSIDSDTSTSDTIALLSSKQAGPVSEAEFRAALTELCRDLTEDVVRNGEGVHHVMRVQVRGAPSKAIARGVGKSIVNSPLVQCAVCGNDPNVGRLVMAIGKYMGTLGQAYDLGRTRVLMGGESLLVDGVFRLDPTREAALVAHLKGAELYASMPPPDGLNFVPPAAFPRHERAVEIEVDLGLGQASATVLGADRSHEYITENADYRS
jgi:glutamate N-acetyltransferase / amino-acid N-acetyltransferase